MADNIDVKATLTADDKASPTIRRILNQIAALEKQLKSFGKTGFAAANNGTIITRDAQKYLDRYGESLKKIPQNYLREARRMRQSGEMTTKGWVDLNNQIKGFDKHIKKANKSGAELSKQQKRQFYDLINQAKAYQYVWNQGHEQRMSLERRLHNEQLRLSDAKARRDGRTSAQWFKEQRYRRNLRIAEQRREEAETRSAEKMRQGHIAQQLRDAEQRRKLRAKLARETDMQARRDLSHQLYLLRMRENSSRMEMQRAKQSAKSVNHVNGIRQRYEREQAREQRRQDIARRTRVNEQIREAETRRKTRLKEFQEHQAMRRQARREAFQGARHMVGAPGRMANRLENPFFSSPYFYAMLAGGAGVMAARSFTRSAISVDRGETFARMHMDQGIVPAAQIRDWALKTAPGMGITPGALIETTVDAAKAGVPDALAQATAEMITKMSKFFGIDVAQGMEGMGYAIAQEIGAGRMRSDDISSVRTLANMGAFLAGKTAARPDQMLSFIRTGLGSGAMLGMSRTATMAFGTSAIEAGAQGQQAARMLGSMAGDINQIDTRAKDLRKQGRMNWSTTDKLFMQAPQLLGYSSHKGILDSFRNNPDTAMVDLLKSFSRIEDFNIRDQLFRSIFGNEFGRFSANLISSPGILDRNLGLAREAAGQDASNDYIEQSFREHRKGLEFLADSINSLAEVIKSEFGDALKVFISDFSTWAQDWHRTVGSGGLKGRFDAGLQGLLSGFGYDTFGQMLSSVFGAPGAFDAAEFQKYFDFAKGFAEGLKAVGKSLMGFMTTLGKTLGIDTSTAEGLGKLTAMILGLSVALHFMRPVFSIMGMVKDGLMAVGGGILFLSNALKALGVSGGFAGLGRALLGGAGLSAVSGLGSTLAAAIVGGLATISTLAITAGVAYISWKALKWLSDPDKQTGEFVKDLSETDSSFMRFMKMFSVDGILSGMHIFGKAISESQKQSGIGPYGVDPNAKSFWETLKDWIIPSAHAGELDPSLRGKANPLAAKLSTSMDDLTISVDKLGARLQLASLTTPGAISAMTGASAASGYSGSGGSGGGAVGAARAYSSTPGAALPGFGYGSRGIIGGGSQGLFDAIIAAEGTARGGRDPYNTVLGYGRWGSPNKPLTDMTLDEVYQHGLSMRRAQAASGTPWRKTSSASGAFQIVGSTMMDAARALGLDPTTTKFDQATQQKMAMWIAQRQGLGAWEGFKNHPDQRQLAAAALANPQSAAGAISGTGMDLVEGAKRISSTFGMRMHPISGAMKMHWGQDIAGPAGSAAKAAKGGQIVDINGHGDMTVLHEDGSKAIYRHITPGDGLAKGGRVEAGQQIGTLRARDPRSTGPHLHVEEIDPSGRKIDPRTSLFSPQLPGSLAQGVPSAHTLVGKVPPPSPAPGSGVGAGGGSGVSVTAPITINGAGQSAEEIANAVQRRLHEERSWATHDVEFDV